VVSLWQDEVSTNQAERADRPTSSQTLAVATKARACLFCGSDLAAAPSREHIFPQWLLRHYEAASTLVEPTYMVIDERQTLSVRRSTFDGLLEGRICAECNSGWMSRLETDAQSVVLAMAEGQRRLSPLGDEERLCLARWATKTAYTLNSAANFPLKVPSEHLVYLASQGAPVDGVRVYGAQCEGHAKLGWVQGPIWRTESETLAQQRYDALAHESYKVALQLGRLMLLVAYWPDPRWRHILATGVHEPIWPRGGARLVYPGALRPMDHPDGALFIFHASLGVTASTVWSAPLQLRGAVGWPPAELEETVQ
jgi:hypothetical protein